MKIDTESIIADSVKPKLRKTIKVRRRAKRGPRSVSLIGSQRVSSERNLFLDEELVRARKSVWQGQPAIRVDGNTLLDAVIVKVGLGNCC